LSAGALFSLSVPTGRRDFSKIADAQTDDGFHRQETTVDGASKRVIAMIE
jgi:hypothetical protein